MHGAWADIAHKRGWTVPSDSRAPTQLNLQLRTARLSSNAPNGAQATTQPARYLPPITAAEIQASATPVSRSHRDTPDERLAADEDAGPFTILGEACTPCVQPAVRSRKWR